MTTIEQDCTAPTPRTGRNRGESKPTLCFVYSPTSGHSRRVEGFLAQVLQRRRNHRAFVLQRINSVERPELAKKLGAKHVPTLVVVQDRRIRARLEGLSGCKEIEQLLEPWLGPQQQEKAASDSVPADARDEIAAADSIGLSLAAGPQESFTRQGMTLPRGLSFDRWRAVGQKICGIADASTWWLADWAAYGESRYGDRYGDAVAITGIGYQTLRNYAWVARRFDLSRRRDSLSFSHHSEVAALPVAEQEMWLDRAEREGWSRNKLRAELRGTRTNESTSCIEHLRLAVSSTRAGRWRTAAEASGLELPAWIASVADRASGI